MGFLRKFTDMDMKANLQCGNDIRNGYVNVNYGPVSLDEMSENSKIVMGDFKNLDPIFENESLDEVLFNPSVSVIMPDHLPDVIAHWRNKLKNKGVLKIHTIDIRKVGRAAHTGELGLQDLHMLILGNNYEYKTIIDTAVLVTLVKKLGFDVDMISSTDFVSTIEAVKNA